MNRWTKLALSIGLLGAFVALEFVDSQRLNPWVVLFVKIPLAIISPVAFIGILSALREL